QIARSRLASAQQASLGVELLVQARVCVEALGRLGRDERSRASLARYLRAELDDVRAYHAAMAFLRWGDEASLEEIYLARKRFGLTSTLSSMLGKHLRRFAAPEASGQERTARDVFELGVRQLAHKDYAAAEATFSRVIQIAPNEVGGWTNRALSRRRQGRPAEALADYEQALRIAPGDPEILARRGMAFYRVGNMKAALRDLDEAIDQRPKLEEALFNRALVFRNLQRYEEALRDLEKLVQLSPRSPGYLRQLSDVYLALDRRDESLAVLDRMVELDPHDGERRAQRAYMYLDSGRHGEAIRELDRTLRDDPNCGMAWAIRGEIAHRRKQLSEAADCFRQGSKLSPTNKIARYLAANFFYGQKDYPSALKEATYLVTVEPQDPTYRSMRGQILFRLRRVQEAFADWGVALRVLPNCKEALFYRGLAFEQIGRPQEAANDFRTYLRFWGDTTAARRIRSRLALVEAQQEGK
ncbi:MAG TPA: hypothetical protein DEA08_02430, partial [Planctomycetes bacterium]|nr:hypothetical protein [Planctomycetota bacterium]